MTRETLVDHLNGDLANEYKHWHYYMNAAVRVQGLHRPEIREFMLKQAESEMQHILQFADLIVGLGGVPVALPSPFVTNVATPQEVLTGALDIEQEVLTNYLNRMEEAEELGGVDGRRVVIFLEDQMDDTSRDVDEIKQLLA